MQTTHFSYRSADKVTDIHAVEWTPEGEIIGVVQIVHGMMEFIDRYEPFALFLCGKGYAVVGHDHLGHGASVFSEEKYGYFAMKGGNRALISDMRQLQRITQEKYPHLPYFMFGHSMGSFLTRQYICMHAKKLDGAILSGTGYHSAVEAETGKLLCRLIARFKGWTYRSKLITAITIGGYNKRFEPAKTKADWLTRDEAIVNAYIADSRTHHMFTLNAYYNMFVGLKYIALRSNLEKIPYTFPVLFVSGAMDPVGNFGAGVRKAAAQMKSTGMKDIGCIFYPNDRHEILNELDREQVYKDIWAWIEKHSNEGV